MCQGVKSPTGDRKGAYIWCRYGHSGCKKIGRLN